MLRLFSIWNILLVALGYWGVPRLINLFYRLKGQGAE